MIWRIAHFRSDEAPTEMQQSRGRRSHAAGPAPAALPFGPRDVCQRGSALTGIDQPTESCKSIGWK
jgi:hypothetical protein